MPLSLGNSLSLGVHLPDVIKAIAYSSSLLFARLIKPCCDLQLLDHPGNFSFPLFLFDFGFIIDKWAEFYQYSR